MVDDPGYKNMYLQHVTTMLKNIYFEDLSLYAPEWSELDSDFCPQTKFVSSKFGKQLLDFIKC